MYYQPPRALGLLVGAVMTLWAVAIALVLLNSGLTSEVGLGWFVSYAAAAAAGVLALLFAYWSYSLATLAYAVDRNGLVIAWGATRQVIPLGAIERLVLGTAVGVPAVRGISWWGHHIGRAYIERIGDVLFYSTHQAPEQVLYVMTAERNYAISVEDPVDFAREIQVRQDLGPTAQVAHHVQRAGTAAQGFWSDPLALALAAAAVLAGALVWAQIALRYPDLPATLDLRFPPSDRGPIVTVVSRDAIFELPRSAAVMLGVNVLLGVVIHGWSRVAAYLLFAAAIVVQLGFFAAIAIALA